MRNVLTIFILFLFWSCTSCNSDSSKHDADTVPDKDSTIDTDIHDATPDEKTDPDIIDADNEKPDEDINVPCLDLKIQANVIKTGFPFKGKNGKPTFCRPGCDTPTGTDPQCVRNIWEWDNWEKYQEYLKAEKEDPEQEWERECYPWPCVLPDMKAYAGKGYISKCDRSPTVNGYQASIGAIWTHGMSEGVAGMNFGRRAIEYDPEKDQFTTVGQAAAMLSFGEGRYVFPVYDRTFAEDGYRSFIVSAMKLDDVFHYELIYNNSVNNSFLSNPSFAGEKWVLIQVRPGKESSITDVKYAKAGEWEWHSLGLGKVLEGNIVGNHLAFMVPYTNPDRQIYYCDLSKYPGSYKDCYKVTGTLESGEAEMGHSPRIDENDENRLIYYIYNKPGNLVREVIFKDDEVSSSKEYPAGRFCQPGKVEGNLMIFTSTDKNSTPIGCWYRFDKQKTYCPEKPYTDIGDVEMDFSTFDGRWHLWKNSISTVMRDWDCYCKETGVCPFEKNDSEETGDDGTIPDNDALVYIY